MKNRLRVRFLLQSMIVFTTVFLLAYRVLAHCDGMDGPVVKAARKALEDEKVNLVLIWVQKKDEPEVEKAFQKAVAVRRLSVDARDLADTYFFETIVRIHRAGEGASYTGLKPAGRDLGPAIPAADEAIASGKAEPLLNLITGGVKSGVLEHYREIIARRQFDPDDVAAGRGYVESYVAFIHYVERVYEAARDMAPGHYEESTEANIHADEQVHERARNH